jgi:hypothetical protein
MAGYSGTALWKKLGYKDGDRAFVEGAPPAYSTMLGLPSDISVQWVRRAQKGITFVHLFSTSRARLEPKLQSLRKSMTLAGMIWVSWPKKSSGVPSDITENVVREIALPLGLVDVKVCAVDDTWSGLKLVIRKELRQ